MKAFIIKKGKKYLYSIEGPTNSVYSKDCPHIFKTLHEAELCCMPSKGEKIVKVDIKISETNEIKPKITTKES